ncbi:adenylate kinase-like kinase [Cylindrospermum stagnale PCC 7417]|uniref:Adenylate kinase-like kinase n=1 Tax=Cylindrospermum stagnale PCC 7417 TaxID=56107 RepID=K9WRY1_9NOST|nr:adenylate kinase-like kinase [Cylindrospermum stagnale]AFZ22539.1 adenylate kinase-like kinase [Cylindrospermum stagnale PCC 7417]
MHRFLIFGNSGSGKSTLANKLGQDLNIPVLDLDTIVWEPNKIAIRRPHSDAENDLRNFIKNNPSWIIEGCYSTLIKIAIEFSTEIYFLNPGVNQCLENNRNRPWEPHKFKSPEEQAQTFEFLQNWIQEYEKRDDEFGYSSHRLIFQEFHGKKQEIIA